MSEIETTLNQQNKPKKENRKVTLMAFSPFGTVKEMKWHLFEIVPKTKSRAKKS